MAGDETGKIVIKQDLIEAYKILSNEFKEYLKQMNEMWFNVVRLIITLSTSILLVTISLIDKIFPLDKAPLFIRNTLVLGWILFFLSIIFGILTELKGAEFFGKMAGDYEKVLKNCLRQMTKGQFGEQEVDLGESFVKYSSLVWGLSEIVMFIFAVLCLSIYSIGNIYNLSIWHVIAIMVAAIILIGILIFTYFKNRK